MTLDAKERKAQAALEGLYKSLVDMGNANAQRVEADKARRVAELKTKVIDGMVRDFLDEWLERADTAVDLAPKPADKTSHVSWFIALLGNWLWAATCFVNPASGITIKIMSVVGSTIGSGGVGEAIEFRKPVTGSPEDAKNRIIDDLGNKRVELDKLFEPRTWEWAREIDSSFLSLPDIGKFAVEEFIWHKMFPTVPHEKRFNEIYHRMMSNITKALADFNGQWQAWNNGPGAGFRCVDDVDHGRYYDRDSELCTFKPKLVFNIPT